MFPDTGFGAPLAKLACMVRILVSFSLTICVFPVSSLLAAPKAQGLGQLMEQLSRERLSVAVCAVGHREQAVSITSKYVEGADGIWQVADRISEHPFKMASVR